MNNGATWVVVALLAGCGESARDLDARRAQRERDVVAFIEQRLPASLGAAPQASVERRSSMRRSAAAVETMVRINPSSWIRGCDTELAGCRPYPDRVFETIYIDAHEVTVAAYDECVQAGACTAPVSGSGCTPSMLTWPRHALLPVNCVTIDEALRYCRFRDKRLPMSTEWERAAHGIDGRAFPWGDARPACSRTVGRGRKCRYRSPLPGGSRPEDRSPDGVFDLAGNLAEYVASRDSERPWPPLFQEIRGGSFLDHVDGRRAGSTRPGFRPWDTGGTTEREFRSPAVGFRCVVNACPSPEPHESRWRWYEPCVPVADSPP